MICGRQKTDLMSLPISRRISDIGVNLSTVQYGVLAYTPFSKPIGKCFQSLISVALNVPMRNDSRYLYSTLASNLAQNMTFKLRAAEALHIDIPRE
jgi:hypothetical protein